MVDRHLIGVSACLMHGDSQRSRYNGRPLLFLEQSMSDWLLCGDLLPFMIPYSNTHRNDVDWDAEWYVDRVDGLVISGGVDVSPNSYGEQPIQTAWEGDAIRDRFEMELIREAIRQNKPVLGICRGHQILNVALGGTLYQDITTQVPHALEHRNGTIYEKNFHTTTFIPNSLLEHIYGSRKATINSVHHQAIKDLGEGLVVEARSSHDDIIEAVRLPYDSHDDPWVVGVQWHPEFQDPADEHLLPTAPILAEFREAIEARKK